MKLNGWIRLWLVLTTIHITGVSAWTAIAWPSLPDVTYSSDQNGVIHMINRTSGRHYYFAKDVPIDMAKDYIRSEEGTDKKKEEEMKEALIKQSIAIMLTPPLVVLLLGYALIWVKKGFKNG